MTCMEKRMSKAMWCHLQMIVQSLVHAHEQTTTFYITQWCTARDLPYLPAPTATVILEHHLVSFCAVLSGRSLQP